MPHARNAHVGHEPSVDTVADDVARAATTVRDHRRAGCERLDHADAEVLLADVDEPAGAGEQVRELLARLPAEKLDVLGQARAQLGLERPRADDRQPVRQRPKRFEHEARPLVRDESAHPEEAVAVLRRVMAEVGDSTGGWITAASRP